MSLKADWIKRALSLCLLCILFAVCIGCSGLHGSLIEIGGFSVKESPSYEIQVEKNVPGEKTTVDGVEVYRTQALAMAPNSEYGVALSCYEDVTFDEAKAYLEENLSKETENGHRFPTPGLEAFNAGADVQTTSISMPNGRDAFEQSIRSSDDAESFFASKIVVFQANDGSLGVIALYAFNPEMLEVEQCIFDEVFNNIVVN